MASNLICEYCRTNVVMVDGFLGPQLFCRACRRFQPQHETTTATALRWWIENRRANGEPATSARYSAPFRQPPRRRPAA